MKRILFVLLAVFIVGCSSGEIDRLKAISDQFPNAITVKSLSYTCQYLVKDADGSIWEVKIDGQSSFPTIIYRNCVFDGTNMNFRSTLGLPPVVLTNYMTVTNVVDFTNSPPLER